MNWPVKISIGVLSTVCSMFDPLGFIAPVILLGKALLQSLCRDKHDWDDPLPEAVHMKWEHCESMLQTF